MENKDIQGVVKDLDLTLQPRSAPRYKVWLPLATQQLRLRCLNKLIGYNLQSDKNFETCWFYFTLHRSSMSSPLYTSEPIDNTNPKWLSLEVSTLHATGLSTANEIVLRVWRRTVANDPNTDITLFTWGISFTGLVYMGPKLSNNLESLLRHNSLIFHLHGGYFVPPYCLIHPPEFRRYLHMSVNNSEICDSYTVGKLSNLRRLMQSLNYMNEAVQVLRDRIASGESIQSPKFKQTALSRLLQPKRVSKEKRFEILKMGKELEIAKFRTKLLEQERIRKIGKLRTLNQLHLSIMEENEDQGSSLMARYRELNKDIERLREWRQNHIQARECYVQTLAQLAYRRRQLISDLIHIHPIRQESEKKFTINNVYLPDSEDLDRSNDIETSVALGFVAQATQMVANFLNIPTRYSIIYHGSRSKIIDHITDNIPVSDRQFPLFSRSKDKLQFNYGVYLLNKNIAQLRWYCGLITSDLRATLPNLASLINMKVSQSLDNSKRTFSGSSLDTDTSNNGKHNIPLTPPHEKNPNNIDSKIIFRSTSSLSQFKSSKTTLGSSLDQGLDKPLLNFVIDTEIKRIYKSEDSAFAHKEFSLPHEKLNNSSEETVYHTDPNLNLTVCEMSKTSTSLSSGIIESDIEITLPTSISHKKYEDECLRQRSSNSISSCEMALTGSQTDVDDRIRDKSNNRMINPINGEYTFLSTECIDPSLIASKCNRPENESIYINDTQSMSLIYAAPEQSNIEKKFSPITGLDDYHAIDSSETLDNFVILSDRTQNISETIGNRDESTTTCVHNVESFYNDNENGELAKNFPTKYKCHSNECLSYEWDINAGAARSLPCSQPIKLQKSVNDYQASTEFINSIRKSSENVFARTEALASKRTSFKLMKPRS